MQVRPATIHAAGMVLVTTMSAVLWACSPVNQARPAPAARSATAASPPAVGPPLGRSTTAPVLIAAGDIGSCSSPGDEATASLLDRTAGTVAALGDTAYPSGSARDFERCYQPSWGRHKARTRPAVGNHEYQTRRAAGYFDYFGPLAGDRATGYYSYDLGSWHIVVINSNCRAVAGCGPESPQGRWLRADLAASAKRCTLAYWHHPLFTSGSEHGPSGELRPIFQTLYQAGAEIVLTAHNHNYERFAPVDPAGRRDDRRGIRTWVVGTGGASHYGFGAVAANSEVREAGTYGVLVLTLRPDGYAWRFVPVDGRPFTDAGIGQCH